MLGGEGEGRERGRVRVLRRGGRVKKGIWRSCEIIIILGL